MRREVEPVIVVQDRNGFEDVVIVLKRFAHSHQHDTESSGCSCTGKDDHLGNDFSRGEIALKTQQSGKAKGTPQGASSLRGNAKCKPLLAGNDHRLDHFAIFKTEEKTASSILGFE